MGSYAVKLGCNAIRVLVVQADSADEASNKAQGIEDRREQRGEREYRLSDAWFTGPAGYEVDSVERVG